MCEAGEVEIKDYQSGLSLGCPRVNAGPGKASPFSNLLLIPINGRVCKGQGEEGRRAGCPDEKQGRPSSLVPRAALRVCRLRATLLPEVSNFPCGPHLNAFPLRIKHRAGGQESPRREWEKTRAVTPEEGKGEHPLPRSAGLFLFVFDFSFKKKKKKSFSSRRFQEQAGGGRGGGFCSRRWSVMSHERVIKGSPVRGAGFL